jgi:ATP-dependent protease ClpP protease subunit
MNFAEIAINEIIFQHRPPEGITINGRHFPADTITTHDDVVSALAQARAEGHRVVLVTMNKCRGGNISAALWIFNALREFSRSGGVVVAHLAGDAMSSAPAVALAADFILMDLGSRYILHSSLPAVPLTGGARARADAYGNAQLLSVFEARGQLSREALLDALSRTYDPATATQACSTIAPLVAVDLGWADAVAALNVARTFAAEVASGQAPSSRRQAWLASRGDAAEPRFPSLAELVEKCAGATGIITGDKLAANTITADKIAAGTITADKIAADALQTSNYAEDGSGNPTAGAKMDKNGTALKVAPGNLQIGNYLLGSTNRTTVSGVVYSLNAGTILESHAGPVTNVYRYDKVTTTPRYVVRIVLNPAAPGFALVAAARPALGGANNPLLPQIQGDSSDANIIDIGLWNIVTGVWVDPNAITFQFSYAKIAAW